MMAIHKIFTIERDYEITIEGNKWSASPKPQASLGRRVRKRVQFILGRSSAREREGTCTKRVRMIDEASHRGECVSEDGSSGVDTSKRGLHRGPATTANRPNHPAKSEGGKRLDTESAT